MTPTPEQEAILSAAPAHPALIIEAGPGCAKTTTLLLLAANAPKVANGLCLAFNREIASTLKTRLRNPRFTAQTFNSLGHNAWNSQLGPAKRLDVQTGKMRAILRSLQDSSHVSIAPDEWDDLLAILRFAKAYGYLPPGAGGAGLKNPPLFKDLCFLAGVTPERHYEALVNKALLLSITQAYAGQIDYDDQIYMPALFGSQWPSYDWLLVDEAQDLTPLQLALVRRLSAKHTILVGDPLQAIYAFRGAMADTFERIRALWPYAPTLPLQTSFRVPGEVLKLLCEHNPRLVSANAEPGTVHTHPGGTYNLSLELESADLFRNARAKAILCRNNAPLYRAALACIASGVRFTLRDNHFGNALIRDIQRAVQLRRTSGSLPSVMRDFWHGQDDAIVDDKVACITALWTEDATPQTICTRIRAVLAKSNESDSANPLILSTAHKAKGLEFDWVLHLDPHLIPNKHAKTPDELQQEANIAYVINSRTRHTLIFARSDQLVIGQGPASVSRPRPDTRKEQPL